MLDNNEWLQTWQSGSLVLDVYQSEAVIGLDMAKPLIAELNANSTTFLTAFNRIASEQGIYASFGINPEHMLEADLTWVTNDEIQALNREHRFKDQATDVLSFCLFADSPMRQSLLMIPEVQLGSIFISLEWAMATTEGNTLADLGFMTSYVVERVIHGLLHLMGVNHDTMTDYNKVVGIQRQVLHETFESASAPPLS